MMMLFQRQWRHPPGTLQRVAGIKTKRQFLLDSNKGVTLLIELCIRLNTYIGTLRIDNNTS